MPGPAQGAPRYGCAYALALTALTVLTATGLALFMMMLLEGR